MKISILIKSSAVAPGILAALLLLISFRMQSQENFVFVEGKEDVSDFTEEIKGPGKDLFLLNDKYHFTVSKIDLKSLNVEFKTPPLRIPDKADKEFFYETMNRKLATFTPRGIEIIYDIWTKKVNKRIIYIKTVNMDGTFTDVKTELMSIDCKSPFGIVNSSYSVCYSSDKSRIAILLTNKLTGESTLKLIDAKDLSTISTTSLPLDYHGAKFNPVVEGIDGAGNITVIFQTIDAQSKPGQKYKGTIKVTASAITDIKESATLDQSKDRYSTVETITEDQKLIQSGLYSATGEIGIFYVVTDLKKNIILQETYSPLGDDISSKLKVQDNDNKPQLFKNFKARNLIELNGSHYLVCENYSEGIIQSTKPNGASDGTAARFYYVHSELILSKFDAAGKNEWNRLIPKYNMNNAGSYDLLVKNNVLCFIYLEHPKNELVKADANYDPKEYKRLDDPFGALITCLKINEGGISTKSILSKNPEDGFCYSPGNAKVKRGDTYLTYYRFRTKSKYGSITVN